MNHSVKLKPFVVPNYVLSDVNGLAVLPGIRQMIELPKFHLRELSPETLDELCNQFRQDVFDKAMKRPTIKRMTVEFKPHVPGSPCPCDHDLFVYWADLDGHIATSLAIMVDWEDCIAWAPLKRFTLEQ